MSRTCDCCCREIRAFYCLKNKDRVYLCKECRGKVPVPELEIEDVDDEDAEYLKLVGVDE